MTTYTPSACVVGWPIAHSRSPLIHGHWLQVHGINGCYGKTAVDPNDFEAFLSTLGQDGFVGCNVTVPLKQAAFALAKHKEPDAVAVEAANTLWLQDGDIHATNTDTYGFMTHLETSAPGWSERDAPALVLGAGGAARAIVYGLLQAGVPQVHVVNRTKTRAEAVAGHFGDRVCAHSWAGLAGCLHHAGLLVNTTSLGMSGIQDLELDITALDEQAVVADIVYSPLETDLLREANRLGRRTVDGLGMLLHQAVPGFERWFGVRPDVTPELRALVVADLTSAEAA